jgi:hypothetical protein
VTERSNIDQKRHMVTIETFQEVHAHTFLKDGLVQVSMFILTRRQKKIMDRKQEVESGSIGKHLKNQDQNSVDQE